MPPERSWARSWTWASWPCSSPPPPPPALLGSILLLLRSLLLRLLIGNCRSSSSGGGMNSGGETAILPGVQCQQLPQVQRVVRSAGGLCRGGSGRGHHLVVPRTMTGRGGETAVLPGIQRQHLPPVHRVVRAAGGLCRGGRGHHLIVPGAGRRGRLCGSGAS